MKHDRFNRTRRDAQRGAALIVLAVILVLGTSGLLLSALNISSSASLASKNAEIARRADSMRALDEAKQALLAYLASQVATDPNPGRLPCPEALSYFGTANAGLSQNDAQVTPALSPNLNPVGGFCGPGTVVGRLPWRTLGISKLVDGYGEPLWYVVSPGFVSTAALPSSGWTLSINSNTTGQLTVDGVSAAAVALVITPGPVMTVPASSSCNARVQTRTAETAVSPPVPALLDYLECENATAVKFVTSGDVTSYNDQVLRVTSEELFDTIEQQVAKRIETEIAPALKTIYLGTDWGLPAIPSLPTTPTNYIYPYAVTFADPTTSLFQGASGVTQGLLPMYAAGGSTSFVYWYDSSSSRKPDVTAISGSISSKTCSKSGDLSTVSTVNCYFTYSGAPRIKITATARSVARTMRTLNASAVPLSWADAVNPGLSVTAAFDTSSSSGRAWVYVQANLPNCTTTCSNYKVTFPITILADHPLTDPSDATTGWFVRNNWHQLVYYAFTPNYAVNQSHSCVTSSSCLTVNNLTPTGTQRALLILMGRTLSLQARSTAAQRANRVNYLEDPENRDLDRVFVKNTTSKSFNDRFVVVDSNP